MALIGGGGAGNVSGGANPAGVGSSLTYIGDHCYANSGAITVEDSGNAGTTLLDFTTGNAYIVAEIHMFNDQANALSVRQSAAKISYDSQTIALIVGSAEDAPVSQTTDIHIPPFTNVKVEVISAQGDSDNFTTVSIVGRVY